VINGIETVCVVTAIYGFITARRYASEVYAAAVVCLSVLLSVTSQYCIETTRRNELIFGTGASFGLT